MRDCFKVMIQSFHAGILVSAFCALKELFLPGLFICEMRVGVKIELVEVIEDMGAHMTPILFVVMTPGVLQIQVQILEKLSTVLHNTFVALLLLMGLEVCFVICVLGELIMTILTLVAGVWIL